VCIKGSFPFVIFCDSDEMISAMKIYLRINSSSLGGIQEIRYKENQIVVLLSNLVQPLVINI